jgi:glycosyltransferase involved in cell wall biosynthesis
MKISVVIASYNGEKYIEDQILSIVGQTLKPDEIILSDDCSNDRTIEKFTSFCKKYNVKYKIISNDYNVGFSKNFENAMLHAGGDLVFISDQDDVWFNNKVEVIAEYFACRPELYLTINDCIFTNQNLISAGVKKSTQIAKATGDISDFIAGCCSVYNSLYFDLIFPIPHNLFVYDSWLHFIGRTLKNIHFIGTPLQYYRRHDSNASGVNFNNTQYLKRRLLNKFINYKSREKRISYLKTELLGLRIIKERLSKFEKSNLLTSDSFLIMRSNITLSIEFVQLRIDILDKNFFLRLFKIINALFSNNNFRNQKFQFILFHLL